MRLVAVIFCGIVLASCSHGTMTSPLPADLPNGASTQPLTGVGYKSLYSFKGGRNGANPAAGLINVRRKLYGTTTYGGSGSCRYSGYSGCGTVFAMSTSGTQTVLHSFAGYPPDGEGPWSGLVNVSGTLYGTTEEGGAFKGASECIYGCGTVFKITTSGKETVLYSFKPGTGGTYPYAGLINVNGTLYGTTYSGGNACPYYGCGTVFKITTSGKETVLHSFGSSADDGAYPYAGLINVNGTLYGTTYSGGNGDGTVFSITLSGKEHVLYSFKYDPPGDGEFPYAGLLTVNGTLYGTTYKGGTNSIGTVFSITPSGTETVLHSFDGKRDGSYPFAGLLNAKGTLYGTTREGGADGYGTVFSLSL
jgi:uncharacterized repeat protein (TIGR03803 family)